MSLVRNFTIVGAATLTSRITGFFRDMLVAATLGASAVADAYVAAFLIPNLFRRLIGEGAFNAAYVPIFTRRETEGGSLSAEAFAEATLSLFLGIGIFILLAGEFLMPQIIGMIAPGFETSSSKFIDAVEFGRIVFPFVAIILLVAVFTGTLNALNHYAVAAWAPVLLNLMLIGVLLYVLSSGVRGSREAGFLLVWTVVGAGLVNLVIVAIAVWRKGYRLIPHWPKIDADMRRLMMIALPGIAIAGAGHINVVVAAQMSSGTPSAVSWLYFAERIFQLPLGFVAAAVGVVLLPAMSRHLASGDIKLAHQAESRALEFGLLITIPAAIALALLAKPIVSILYERGAFTSHDSSAVAMILRMLAFGLPAFVLVKVFLPAFLAREDMKGPLIAAMLGIIFNVITALVMQPVLGAVAPALGVTVSAVVNATMLYVLLLRSGRFRPDRQARRRLPRILLACILSGAAIWFMVEFSRPWLKPGLNDGGRILALGLLCFASITLHIAISHLLRAIDLKEMRQTIRADR
jgi:putative peptidoglycan lipid II flippase